MKSIKNLCLLSMVVLLICSTISCKKDNKNDQPTTPNYSELIVGSWLTSNIEGTDNLTDQLFVNEFHSNNLVINARGIQVDENNSFWSKNSNLTYHLENNVLIIQGTNPDETSVYIETEISFPNNNTVNCIDRKVIIGGVEYEKMSFSMQRIQIDYHSAIVGSWAYLDNSRYAVYYEDGTYDYYKKNDEGNWFISNGVYLLYGDLFVTEWNNDQNHRYENWMLQIEDNKMIWTGNRADGPSIRELYRTDSLPIVQ